jgi:hypothetical protein
VDGLQLVYESRGLYLWLGLFALFVLLAAAVALLHLRLGSVITHYRLLCRGAASGNLDQLLEQHLRHADDVTAKLAQLTAYCQQLDATTQRSLQRVGVVRFNPFDDVGGDQSFSVALLDAAGNGIVISSLFGRRESRVYVKPIDKGQSKYPLSGEEQQAIRLAGEQAAGQRVR